MSAATVDAPTNINNTFPQHTVDADQPLPGPLNLNSPLESVFAWAPRSDLPAIEGAIPEDSLPPIALANTFIDLTGFIDKSGGTTHSLSMIAYGLGLNSATAGMPNGMPGFVTDKYTYLGDTVTAAGSQINSSVQGMVQSYINQAQTYFNSGVSNSDPNSYGCAMNSLATADNYVRANLSSFSGLAPPGNVNPAGDIDGRLANLFLTIDLYFLSQPPNMEWPTNNVPPCMMFSASPTTVIAGNATTLTWVRPRRATRSRTHPLSARFPRPTARS